MDYIKDLHELCETISEAIKEANEKIRTSGGKLSGSDVDYVDKLTHALKSVKATIAMMEDEGYSSYYPYMGGAYADGSMNRGGSYRGSYRGRSYARRDSMGRYSRDGYSRDADMVEELRELMNDAKDDRTRQEFKRFIEKLESM
jgi:hypothetical protein